MLTVCLSSPVAHPMMANAGSSCRSKGKSMRKFVLNRAVMVTGEEKGTEITFINQDIQDLNAG